MSTDLQSDGVSLEVQAYRISAYCVAPKFYHHTVKRILADHGLVVNEKHPSTSVEQRIVNHHKPIIEIVPNPVVSGHQ